MGYSDTIKRAAITAKLLGYTTIYMESTEGTEYLYVLPPNSYGLNNVHYPIDRVMYYTERDTERSLPTETEALGHFLVRLHMEEHYGIKTDHYWEYHDTKVEA